MLIIFGCIQGCQKVDQRFWGPKRNGAGEIGHKNGRINSQFGERIAFLPDKDWLAAFLQMFCYYFLIEYEQKRALYNGKGSDEARRFAFFFPPPVRGRLFSLKDRRVSLFGQ